MGSHFFVQHVSVKLYAQHQPTRFRPTTAGPFIAESLDQVPGLPDDTAVLFATHDVDLALRRADRIAILDRGQLVRVCSPAALIAAPGDVTLPALAVICRDRGLPYLAPADLAAL